MIHRETVSPCLKKCGNEIKDLLLEMYPGKQDVIEYHFNKDVPFSEWFAFLFDGMKWTLEGPMSIPSHKILISEKKFKSVQSDFENDYDYNILLKSLDVKKLGYITLVKPDDMYRIVDGYHRYYALNYHDIINIDAYQWIKYSNIHPNALKIRQLILNNL